METPGVRATSTLSWFRRNSVVSRRGTPAEGNAAIQMLVEAAERWLDRAPGIRYGAFRGH